MLDPDKVRAYIRDRSDLNYLLNNQEQFDDDEIGMFEIDFLEELLLSIPSLKAKKNKIPEIIRIYGTIAKLMESVSQQENRNQITVGDDNVGQIDISNKSDKYAMIAQKYEDKAFTLAQKIAASSFYNDAWGEVFMQSSDYEFDMGGY